MKKDRFLHHCLEAEAGRDAFVTLPASGEEGIVIDCSLQTGHMVVRTSDNREHRWDYHMCEDLELHKSAPMG